jgi:hypothetical protein
VATAAVNTSSSTSKCNELYAKIAKAIVAGDLDRARSSISQLCEARDVVHAAGTLTTGGPVGCIVNRKVKELERSRRRSSRQAAREIRRTFHTVESYAPPEVTNEYRRPPYLRTAA